MIGSQLPGFGVSECVTGAAYPDLMASDLNPAQQGVLEGLLGGGLPDSLADPNLRNELVEMIEAGTAQYVGIWFSGAQEPLFVGKTRLGQVHECEGEWMANRQAGFMWTLPTVVGVVTQFAIQHQHQDRFAHEPGFYIGTAEDAVRRDHSASGWFDSASEGEVLELRSRANSLLLQWDDSWPPMKEPGWLVRAEPRYTANLNEGQLVLSARPDLVLGPTPRRALARQVIVDIKTSADLAWETKDEAWFYALAYTLRIGIPPARSAVYAIPSGRWTPVPEIDADKLRAAAQRVIHGVKKMVELDQGRPAVLTPNIRTYCAWCPARDSCVARARAGGAASSS